MESYDAIVVGGGLSEGVLEAFKHSLGEAVHIVNGGTRRGAAPHELAGA